MEEEDEQDLKVVSNKDFLEKCKDPQQKDGVINFLHTIDSYYHNYSVNFLYYGVKELDIKLQLFLRFPDNDFKKVVNELHKKRLQKLIKKEDDKKDDENKEENENDDKKIDSETPNLTFDDLLSYFLNKDFNEFSCPEEINFFISKYTILNNVYKLKLLNHLQNQFKKLLNKENIDLHNYFYTNRKNNVFLMRAPKQEFFDLCVEKELGAWAGFAFAYLPCSKQTKENFLKIWPKFRVSALALSNYNSWKLIDCLSKKQKQELVDKKIITEQNTLYKINNSLIVSLAYSIIFLVGLIASCIFAHVFAPIAASIFITLFAFGTVLGIGATIYTGHDLYKINKFNEEVGIAQSETTTLANDTNNPTVTAEVENENTQGNDSPNQLDPQPHMDEQIKNQSQSNDERSGN